MRLLADDLLITVTNFFRDPEVFEYLEREIIPRLFSGRTGTDNVRAWTVGCATGEEAYSLAILLLEAASRHDAPPPRIQVFASDIHEQSLAIARQGYYSGDIRIDVSDEILDRYFVKQDGGYRVRREVRELVVFTPHNFLADPPFSKLELVACRNVMIYLERDAQQEALQLFHYALNPDGFLILGSSESLNNGELFQVEDKKRCVYRRRGGAGLEPRFTAFSVAPTQRSEEMAPPSRRDVVHSGVLHQRIVERYAPPSVLVSDDDRVLHLSEHAGRYLAVPGGEPTTSVIKLVRPELRVELRAALQSARNQDKAVTSRPVPVRFDGEARLVSLLVRPALEPSHEGMVLVIFDERGAQAEHSDAPAEERSQAEVRELESEMELLRQRFMAIVEDYETSQEEMKASHEEMQSANEELRSTMEELETSREELQSANEELQTANQENRHRVEELAQLSSDLQNLLTTTDIATLFLDRSFRILRFTPQVSTLFNVRSSDRGRPISDFTHHLGYADLLDDARSVLESLVPVEREVTDSHGKWYLTRVRPYRSTEDRIEGIVITFVDITGRKLAEESLRRVKETLEERVEERTRQVRELAHRLTLAEQEERRRISRILHDDLQQLLYGVEIKLGLIRQDLLKAKRPRLDKALDEAREWIDRAITTARELTVDISPPILQNEGLVDALEWLQRQMNELHGLQVEIEAPHRFVIANEDLRVLLFHVVRELLFNVRKHAGVSRATVRLAEEDDQVVIHVVDQGTGFDVNTAAARATHHEGFGLFAIRERLALLSGRMTIRSSPGGGTDIEIHAPLALPEPGSSHE